MDGIIVIAAFVLNPRAEKYRREGHRNILTETLTETTETNFQTLNSAPVSYTPKPIGNFFTLCHATLPDRLSFILLRCNDLVSSTTVSPLAILMTFTLHAKNMYIETKKLPDINKYNPLCTVGRRQLL